jgi:hypothetical protein
MSEVNIASIYRWRGAFCPKRKSKIFAHQVSTFFLIVLRWIVFVCKSKTGIIASHKNLLQFDDF